MKQFFTSLAFLLSGVGLLNAQQHVQSERQPTVSSGMVELITDNNDADRQLNTNNLTTLSTPIWGASAAVGSSDGEFANAFVQAGSYAAGDNTTSWTALSVFDTDNTVTPGNAYWTRNTLGYSQGAYWGATTPVGSNSAANGVAIFDSDFLDNGGLQGAFGSGTSPSAHKGELISPRIDLTGYTDQSLSVEFFSFYREFDPIELSVSLSTDDGTTWTTVDYKALSTNQTEERVNAVFPNVTAGVSNLSQCRIKFTFEGFYYFYIIDDVVIQTAPAYDLTITKLDASTGTSGLNFGDQVHITGNRFFPVGQLTQDAGFISFGANVKNLGSVDLATSLNPTLSLNVDKLNDITGIWSSVHTQDIAASQDITAGGGLSLTGTLNDTSWMTVGSYRATYTASFTGTDADTSNNTAQHFFDLTANNYASKVSNDVNENPAASRSIFPGGGPYSQFEYGSVFNLGNASGSGLEINEIKFVYRLNNSFTGAANQTVFVYVYSINDADNNGIITDQSELTQIGLGLASLTGLGTTLPVGDYYTASVTNLVNASTGSTLGELPSGKYFISVVFNPSLTGGQATFDVNDVPWMGASDVKNYNMNFGLIPNSTDFIFNPSALGLIDAMGTTSFNHVGFGVDVVPSIGVLFSTSRNTTVADGSYSTGSTWSNGLIPVTNETTVINHDIVVDNDATLMGNTSINNDKSLTVESGVAVTLEGSLDNSNGGDLIFKSDATGVGQLLVSSGGSLSGPATVERFIPALANTRRAFRFITPGVTTTGSIYENWQENGNTPTAYGTHITGSTMGANGFDATNSGNPSLFTYEHLSDSWQAIPNTDTEVLEAGRAYRIMVRGDRNFDLTNTSQQAVNSDVILRATGNLNLADVNLVGNVISGNDAGALSRQAGEFSFIGNPYQAIVDFESLAKTNINPNFMYIWNPNLSTAGAYETVDVSGAVDARQYVQPGQAFFVLTENNGDAAITFNEAAKSPADFSNANFSTPVDANFLDLELSDTNGLLLDRLNIKFDGDNVINNLDAPKFYNIHESLSTLTQGANFSIEHRDEPIDGEILQLHLIGHDRLNYELEVNVNLPLGYNVLLVDNFLGSSVIMEQGVNTVTFSVDNGLADTTAADRFQLRFEQEELLSITETQFNVYPNPSSNGQLTVSSQLLTTEDVEVRIINMLGQVLSSEKYASNGSGNLVVDTTTIPEGTYILTVNSQSVNVARKIIIE
jgi:hypothetical protein